MSRAKIFACFLAAAMLFAALRPAVAVQPDEVLPNSQMESRARALSAELRCLVCRNETIDDSDAPLARDLRLLLRRRLAAGDSDRQALDFIAARYGSYVLLKPPFWGSAMLLWLFPLLVLLLAAVYLAFACRKQQILPKLTAAEEAKLQALLAEEDDAAAAKARPPR